MPTYKVHYFFIRRPSNPIPGTSGPSSGSGGPSTEYARFLQRFREILLDLFRQSVNRIPGNDASNTLGWQVQLSEIPQGSGPGIADFSAHPIQNFEPVIYICGTSHSATPGTGRRASLTMLDAVQDGRFQNIPSQSLSQFRQGLRVGRPYQAGGMACIPWDSSNPTDDLRYAPVVAEVFSNLSPMSAPALFANMTISEMARNWGEIMANFLAKASFHEIAHCKAESHNRSTGSTYGAALSGSIHNESGVRLLSATVAYNDSATGDDYRVMGNYMLCPTPFYKLDEPISPQCTDHGTAHPLTAAPPPPPPVSTDPFDGVL